MSSMPPPMPPQDPMPPEAPAGMSCPACGAALNLTAAPPMEEMPMDQGAMPPPPPMGGPGMNEPPAEPDGDEASQLADKYQGGGRPGLPMPNKKKSADLIRNF